MNETDRIASEIVDSSVKIHKELGPGLLESVYEACLVHELSERGFHVDKQIDQAVRYDGLAQDAGYRIDLLVNDLVIVALKAVEQSLPIHSNAPFIENGISRVLSNT